MDRLFLRIQLHMLASLFFAGILCSIFIGRRIDERVSNNVEETYSVPVALMAHIIAENRTSESDIQKSLERSAAQFGTGVALIRRSDAKIDDRELERLDRGEVIRTGRLGQLHIFARIEGTDKLIRLGPLNVAPALRGGLGIGILLVVVMALSIGVHWFLRPIRRRLADLGQTASALGRGELSARAKVESHDAIGTLALAFNRMAAEIERLIDAQEELLRMTSHELRTPIQRLHFALESVRDAEDETGREHGLRLIERDLDELDRLIEELLTYVRLGDHRLPAQSSVDVHPLMGKLFEVLSELKGDRALTTRMPAEKPLWVDVEARLLRRAVSNLVVNALRHAHSRVEINVTREERTIRIDVDDDGPGIAVADRERIFEPFQRLDDERTQNSRGFGLGLAIVRRIAEVHGGSVVVLESDWGGARMRLLFPQNA